MMGAPFQINFKELRFTNVFLSFKDSTGKPLDKNHERLYYFLVWDEKAGVEVIAEGYLRRNKTADAVSGRKD